MQQSVPRSSLFQHVVCQPLRFERVHTTAEVDVSAVAADARRVSAVIDSRVSLNGTVGRTTLCALRRKRTRSSGSGIPRFTPSRCCVSTQNWRNRRFAACYRGPSRRLYPAHVVVGEAASCGGLKRVLDRPGRSVLHGDGPATSAGARHLARVSVDQDLDFLRGAASRAALLIAGSRPIAIPTTTT